MYSDSPRSTFQKILLCLFAAMAVVFAVWTAVSRSNEGVLFREVLLKVSEQGNTTVYSGELYDTAITITCREENGAKLVNFSADGEYYANCRVEYPEGTIKTEFGAEVMRIKIIRDDEVLFSGGYDPNPSSKYMNYFSENGEWDPFVTGIASGSGDPWHYFEFNASDIMHFTQEPGLSAYGSWLHYFIALFGTILGALLTAFPYATFYLGHFLSVRDPEPTDLYLLCHKIGSAVYAVVMLVYYWKGLHTIV